MLINKIIEYTKGKVCYKVTGVFPDIFFDECQRQNIKLRSIRKQTGQIIISISYSDRNKLYNAAGNTGADLELLKESGLFSLINKYRFRIGIPLGLMLGAVLFSILSGIVWSVEVDGCNIIDKFGFMEYMKAVNIKKGAYISCVDCSEAEYFGECFSDNIEKVTVNIIGGKIFINVKERKNADEINNVNIYGNIIAKKNGEIISADVLAGTSEIKEGDGVLKGQLLAGGVIELSDGSVRYLQAKAIVIARTHNIINSFSAQRLNVMKIENIKKIFIPYFFIGPDKSSNNKQYDIRLVSNYYLRINKSVIPVGCSFLSEMIFNEDTISLENDQAFLISFSDYAYNSFSILKNIDILERKENIYIDKGVGIEADYVCEEDIAQPKKFELLTAE